MAKTILETTNSTLVSLTKTQPTVKTSQPNKHLRIGLVVPHIFMHEAILPHVIFSPGQLALELTNGLVGEGVEVSLFTPGPLNTPARNITADLSYFEAELRGRGDTFMDLLKKHPQTFIALARQVQSELIAKAFEMANNNELDVVHIYTNEEDIALPFAMLCQKPVVFTHHDPFNFLVRYKSVFPKYPQLNWISMSYAQRLGMPKNTNWVANIYHGLDPDALQPNYTPSGGYIAFLGRIIEPKGVHLAIAAVKEYNRTHKRKLKLKIAGKHYADTAKDTYWKEQIEPLIDDKEIVYVGYLRTNAEKQEFLGNAEALIVPSTFEEPFGMVIIEALATGTPVIGLNSGAIGELIIQKNGILVEKHPESAIVTGLAAAIARVHSVDRQACRQDFMDRFTLERMVADHVAVYKQLAD